MSALPTPTEPRPWVDPVARVAPPANDIRCGTCAAVASITGTPYDGCSGGHSPPAAVRATRRAALRWRTE